MNFSDKYFVIHYAEVGLKGKNRVFFEKKLARNIRLSLRGTDYAEVKRLHDRIVVYVVDNTNIKEIENRLRRVMGIAHFELVYRTEKEIAAIKETALRLAEGKAYETLKVETKRTDKSFP